MSSDFLPVEGGVPVEVTELRLDKSRNLADTLASGSLDFATFVEAQSIAGGEVVVFDVEVELPQIREHEIQRTERIAAVFYETDDSYPEVLALRSDFPQVPHLNLRAKEVPRSLCLYDESYAELKRRWTPARFVARIREWLAETATGNLHQPDQPLEPLLSAADGIILLPTSAETGTSKALRIVRDRQTDDETESGNLMPFAYRCAPQVHGVIRRRPQTLADLASMLGDDFMERLREHLRALHTHDSEFLDASLIIFVRFPKTRTAGGNVESIEDRAFQLRLQQGEGTIVAPIRRVAEDVGVLAHTTEGTAGALIHDDTTMTGENILLRMFNPMSDMDPSMLAERSGQPHMDVRICAIGVGALGSQVVLNLARAGYGTWTLIDDDILLPHNLVRHALPGYNNFVGQSKAVAVAHFAASLTDVAPQFQPIWANVLAPGEHETAVTTALDEAEVILDMSASVAVARHLAINSQSTARRMSMFLTPTGRDLVLLAEDRERSLPLDELEMQYYRACVHDDRLASHIGGQDDRLRYGQSCRDVSTRLPQTLFGTLAGIGAQQLRPVVDQPNAKILVWRSGDDGAVDRIELQPSVSVRSRRGEWTVVVDRTVLDRLHNQRSEKLPTETGGVLIGAFDLERKAAYVVDSIGSPADSIEWPNGYIRGHRRLLREVERVSRATDGMLEYVGEWHSHPEAADTAPSQLDRRLFAWLKERMQRDGLPTLMMIVGNPGHVSCFVEEIGSTEELL